MFTADFPASSWTQPARYLYLACIYTLIKDSDTPYYMHLAHRLLYTLSLWVMCQFFFCCYNILYNYTEETHYIPVFCIIVSTMVTTCAHLHSELWAVTKEIAFLSHYPACVDWVGYTLAAALISLLSMCCVVVMASHLNKHNYYFWSCPLSSCYSRGVALIYRTHLVICMLTVLHYIS